MSGWANHIELTRSTRHLYEYHALRAKSRAKIKNLFKNLSIHCRLARYCPDNDLAMKQGFETQALRRVDKRIPTIKQFLQVRVVKESLTTEPLQGRKP